jgi:hypothetical protein
MVDGSLVDRVVWQVLSAIKNHMRALPARISSLLEGQEQDGIQSDREKCVDPGAARVATSTRCVCWLQRM